mmetsp:Transcript_7491/g.15362  ORF Transcript_7491/g.15362 Transcript_7491/m.15362 type:complete len:406 (-) Transcript_7491:69-1286(-)
METAKAASKMTSFAAATKNILLPRGGYAAVVLIIIFFTVATTPSVLAFTTPTLTPLSSHASFKNNDVSNNRHPLIKRGALLHSTRDDNDDFTKTSPTSQIEQEGIRLNKVFKATHSRRAADKLIEEGRVTINGERVHEKGGYKVIPFRDVVTLDGKVVEGWEQINAISRDNAADNVHQNNNNNKEQQQRPSNNLQTSSFEYVKYYKPIGVTCTTDLRVKDNIIDSINHDGYIARHRVYPVGRLDKETSGLIILTSDGRIVNAVLRGERKQPKVYKVKVDGLLEDRHLQRLRDGIIIRTVAQRKGRSEEENTLIAKTKQCKVERIGPSSVEMTLVEGRNRQIRKMMEAIGFNVVKLHRVEFMGIKLSRGLTEPGDWNYLDEEEMNLVKAALRSVQQDQEEDDGRGY